MARKKFIGVATTIQNGDIEILPAATVTVYRAGTGTVITVYDQESGGGTSIVTNGDGEFFFWMNFATTDVGIKIKLEKSGYDDIIIDDITAFETASFLYNDSGISGDTVKDALDNLDDGKDDLWLAQPGGDANGDFGVEYVAGGGTLRMSFFAPHNFASIVKAALVFIPGSTNGSADIDISSDYAAAGEAYTTHSESDSASTYSYTANQIFELDISGILSALSADDYIGLTTVFQDAENYGAIGIRFQYD